MKNKEIEELLDKLKDKDWYDELDLTGTRWIELKQEETNLLLSYIEQLENNKEKEYVLVGRMQLKTRDYIHQLEKENKQLENNRDKAIEYVKEFRFATVKFEQHSDTLLNILKGDSDV